MTADPTGRDLFIVDNSVSGWTGLRYLEEWVTIAKSFDIATGYFEIGALLALDGKWQTLEKIRILMGSETSYRTRTLLIEGLQKKISKALDESIDQNKDPNPFLTGVEAILAAVRSGQIECRVYDLEKFHAKAYITHSKLEVVGSQALVGSSNFTKPGLTTNIELNVQIQSAREVAQLQEWFEEHWNLGTDVTELVARIIERHTREYTPFDVYTKALQEFFRGHELTASEWEDTRSKMYPRIDRYQKEAYWSLLKIAETHRGAFLCDGVGLGKTFVGLMLIERLILHDGKRVVLFAPKAAKEAVWEPHLKEWLPHIGGVGSGVDFSSLAVFSHTDLARKKDFPERFRRIGDLADVVIIDEAHHFRNPGQRVTSGTKEPSRYYRLYDMLDDSLRAKQVYMLTATPINNRLSDFRHMAELFTRRDEAYFARTIGVTNLKAHFNRMEKTLHDKVGYDTPEGLEQLAEAQELLKADEIFEKLVVQRSRSYARESQMRESKNAAVFPDRRPPQVAEYSIRKSYGQLLDLLERAFQRKEPLFSLSVYYPTAYARITKVETETRETAFEKGRQEQIVGLIRTQFLKRFESSFIAFELSCTHLLQKLIGFVEKHSETDSEKSRLKRWKAQNSDVIEFSRRRLARLWNEVRTNGHKRGKYDENQHVLELSALEPAPLSEEETLDRLDAEDFVSQELMDSIALIDRKEFRVEDILSETFLDLDQLVQFLNLTQTFSPKQDDKLQKLIRLLKSKELQERKVLVFTEFADTARYLKQCLDEAGIKGVAQVDSSTKQNRADVIRQFAPYYNGSSSPKLTEMGQSETRVLISTDVLSEGLNLQDATLMINYDIHWNPVRLMQRIGRVDRRLNPVTEAKLIADHPEEEKHRGVVEFWNFLPPEELNAILSLYQKVTQKTLLISRTLGIEGKKLLTPEDDFEALKQFNQDYEGTRSATEEMLLEYQALLQKYPDLEGRLNGMPSAIFSGREHTQKGSRGVFCCYALPAQDRDTKEYTESAGNTKWYFYDLVKKDILEEAGDIVGRIRSAPDTPRHLDMDPAALKDIRTQILKHIRNTYLKRIDAPIGIKPSLKCWMELN